MAQKSAKKGKSTNLSLLYTIEGGKIQRKNKSCPKCGPGMFLAKHKDRLVCGNCKYTEFLSKEKK